MQAQRRKILIQTEEWRDVGGRRKRGGKKWRRRGRKPMEGIKKGE